MGIPSWSPEQEQQLIDLWEVDKLSAQEISEKLPFSRNAILGKARRMNLSGRRGRDPGKPIRQPRRLRSPRPRLRNIERPPPVKLAIDPRMVTFEQLGPTHCKYPIGDVGDPNFRFCGADRLPDCPYCASHMALCYQPKRARYLQAAE